jgi:hypothetical protein
VKLGRWRNGSSGPAVPLSKIQTDILRLLVAHRDPESYVAGATPLNRNAPRISNDIGVFHDREERVAAAALDDTQTLAAAGYHIVWLRQLPLMYTAEVTREGAGTRLEWVVESDYRFFATQPDETFGYVLHPIDLAMNKVMAAAGRCELRDIVDLVTVHQTILPLGAVIWAAVENRPAPRPKGLLPRSGATPTIPPPSGVHCKAASRSIRKTSRRVSARRSPKPKPLSRGCPQTNWVYCFCKRAESCNPIPTDWPSIKPTPDSGGAIGRGAPKSVLRCSSVTTRNEA